MGGEHLAVGVDGDAGAFGLLQQVGYVVEVVAADEYARTLACADVHAGDLRFTVGRGVGLVEQSHHADALFACLEE